MCLLNGDELVVCSSACPHLLQQLGHFATHLRNSLLLHEAGEPFVMLLQIGAPRGVRMFLNRRAHFLEDVRRDAQCTNGQM